MVHPKVFVKLAIGENEVQVNERSQLYKAQRIRIGRVEKKGFIRQLGAMRIRQSPRDSGNLGTMNFVQSTWV